MKDIYNYLYYHDKLSSSGMPTEDQVKSIADAGIQVLVNLAPHDVPQALLNEKKLVESLGMEYIHIPVNWGTPTSDGLNIFMDKMDASSEKKIHVHCEANFRASAFIAIYRIMRLGWQEDESLKIMRQIWDEDAYPIWKMFIEDAIKRSANGS